MDFTKLSQFISIAVTLSAPVVTIFIILFFVKGKRSILTGYLWKIVFKNEMKIENAELDRYVKEKTDLEKFRLHYPKIKFHNTRHAIGLLVWSENNNVGMDEVSRYHEGFIYNRRSPETINFSLPSGLGISQLVAILFSMLFSGLLVVVLWAAPLSGFGDSILVKTKTTDKWLLINKNNSISSTMFDEAWKATENNCNQILHKQKLTKYERDALCGLITEEGKISAYFEKSKKETKITS